MFGHDDHNGLFGDLNRDGREDWQDDLLGLWVVGETLRLQREKRESEEALERQRREREQTELWRSPRTNDDDDWPPYQPAAYRYVPPAAASQPIPPTPPARVSVSEPSLPERASLPETPVIWWPWLVMGGGLVLLILLALAGGR